MEEVNFTVKFFLALFEKLLFNGLFLFTTTTTTRQENTPEMLAVVVKYFT